jgi:phthalate 4,5-cis-dihydrodiol dehydrogenase
MREVVASGAIGRLRHVSATAHTGWLRRERPAADLDERQGGGVVFNQAPHQVDTIRLLVGGRPAQSIRGVTAAWSESRGDAGHFRAEIEFEDGITGVLAYDGNGYLYSTGLVAADGPPSPVLADAGLVIASGSTGAVRPAGDHLRLVTDDGARDVAVRPGNATSEAISELLAARRTGVQPLHAGDWGRDTLEIVAALLESARRGTPVQFATREERNAVL